MFRLSSRAAPDQPAFRSWQTATKNLNDEAIRRSRTEFETAATEIIIRQAIPGLPGLRILPQARGIAEIHRQEYRLFEFGSVVSVRQASFQHQLSVRFAEREAEKREELVGFFRR